MCDIRMVVEARRVVIDVGHRHGHGGGAGEALWLSPICCHHQQLVIGPLLPVQQRAGDDLSCSRVDRELAMSAAQAVTVEKTEDRSLSGVESGGFWQHSLVCPDLECKN